MQAKRVRKTAGALALFALGMFAFGYALAPLYRVYCDLTGRGSNNALSAAAARSAQRDETRLVTVVFDTNTRDIPWSFRAERNKMRVRPGELNEAVFLVRNKSGRNITGRAIPSVSPVQAGVYFSKTECFCFLEQALAPGEGPRNARAFSGGCRPARALLVTHSLVYVFWRGQPGRSGTRRPGRRDATPGLIRRKT